MFDWTRVWLIARRELTTRFQQRSYRWTTIIQIVVVAIVAMAPVIIARFTDDDGAAVTTVAVVDQAEASTANRLAPYLDGGGELDPMTVTSASTPEDAQRMVDDGDVDLALVVTRETDGNLTYVIATEDGEATSTEAQRLTGAVTILVTEDRLVASGLSPEQAQGIFAPANISYMEASGTGAGTSTDDPTAAEYIISYVAVVLVFMAIMMYGNWIAQGVVEEKSSRIMEIMVNAATPRDLLAGKVIGIMLAALCQMGPMLLVGGVIFALQPRIADLLGVDVTQVLDVDFGALSARAFGWFLVYFFLGFTLYGALYAGVGSLVSRQEEVGQATAPMTTVLMIGYFLTFIALGVPDSTLAMVMNLVPFTSPFVGVPRVLLADAPVGETLLSAAILAVFAVAAMWFAGRLYRVGVLMYGQRPSWKRMLRLGSMQEVAR